MNSSLIKKLLAVLFLLVCILSIGPAHAYTVSEPDFSSMMEENGAVMLLIDPETSEILYANEAAAKFYGYSKIELETMKITQINMLSSEEVKHEMQDAALENRNYFVFKHRLADNDIRTVEVYSYPVQYEGKQVLFSIIHDETGRVILQEKQDKLIAGVILSGIAVIVILLILLLLLQQNRKKIGKAKQRIENYSKLIDTFINAYDSMIYLKDENLNYVFANESLKKFFKKSSDEIVGKDDYALSDTAFAEIRRQADQAVLSKKRILSDEVEWNGHVYSTTKFPVRMLNGDFGVGAYIMDITSQREQKKLQDKISERNKILIDVISLSFHNKQEQLDYVLHRALDMTDSKYGYIYYYNEETEVFTANSWTRGVMEDCNITNPQTRYELNKTGIWGEVVRQRKPIIVNRFQEPNPLKKGYPEGHVELGRFMSVPVIIDEKIVVVIGLGNKQTDYDDNDVDNVTILMGGTWQAIQRKETQELLSFERNKYLQTLISIGDGVMVVDRNARIEMLNGVAQRLTGWTNEDAQGRDYKEVFVLSHEYPNHSVADPIEGVLKTNTVQELGNHAILTARDGTRYHLEDSAAPIFNERGVNEGVVLVFRDVTEKKEQRNKIEYLSFHDTLTGLYNRRYFEEELLQMDTEQNLPISIVMGDVNGLKLTNDVFGHTAGDVLLMSIADALRVSGRPGDIIARWGGDEFVMLLPKTSSEEAKEIVSKIKDKVVHQHVKAIKGSISLGIGSKTKISDSISDALDEAEDNMYSEKTIESETVRDDEIKIIMDTLHTISPREKEHSEEVSRLCEAFGKAAGLSEVKVKKLKGAGYLHDIGKIVLRPELLNENYPLTEEDLNEVRKHAAVGYRILNSSEKTLDFAEAVLAHHEFWDGTGYPKGLKEEEIPLIARIIMVIGTYERIANKKGDKALNKREAVEALRKGSGTQFDPNVVETFLQMLESEI
ncbi:hypothetical protein SDC9_55870 [bioreactor metagenome]|uniref:Uncharacterized protein n=1 Tax=bioreactor metagenome TaxID=1076179 RepID=A0A644X0E0_9ZZZZ